ncbi:MAG: hypothetical protein GF364_22270 [Candidatus Lokiarchaeota archaeon]|nr:hypothetical protein [Candidatus Lokiarchaeota archaeon]
MDNFRSFLHYHLFKLGLRLMRYKHADLTMDEDEEEFCYFAKPVMQLGLPYEGTASMVTHEGYLYNESSELRFWIGKNLIPVNKRVKRLKNGYLPEVIYKQEADNLIYEFRMFQIWLDEEMNSTPINLIKVLIKNNTDTIGDANVATGYKFGSKFDDHRGGIIKRDANKPMKFSMKWEYLFKKQEDVTEEGEGRKQEEERGKREKDVAEKGGEGEDANTGKVSSIRDGHIIYQCHSNQFKVRCFRFLDDEEPYSLQKPNPYKGVWRKSKFTGIMRFNKSMQPGETSDLLLVYPRYPISSDNEKEIHKLISLQWENFEQKFTDLWNKMFENGIELSIPEEKVQNTSKTSLMNNFMCLTAIDGSIDKEIEQHVNRFQYNDFWLRDGAFFSKMYNIFGYPDIAEKIIRCFMRNQKKNGVFMSHWGQYDGFGQVLWSIGEHIKINHEKALDLAEKIIPNVQDAIDWFSQNVYEDCVDETKIGLMPSTNVLDNEQISGRYTGHNIWAWNGLSGIEEYYKLLKQDEELNKLKEMKSNFSKDFRNRLEQCAVKNQNFAPPGLNIDAKIGIDWGNLLLIYPGLFLDKEHSVVSTTIDKYRNEKYAEGIATYTPYFLHHYLTERIAQQNIIRNKQKEVLEDFYAMLVHTGSCNGGFEWCIPPYCNRDYYLGIWRFKFYNFPPHGWFALAFNTLLRNMLIREEENNLFIFSVISPEWLKTTQKISILDAPTYFGKFSVTLDIKDVGESQIESKLELKINSIKRGLDSIRMPYPFYIDEIEVKKKNNDEISVERAERLLIISDIKPKTDIELTLTMKFKGSLPNVSYQSAVDNYKKEFREKINSR